jgi:hypothetical protein
LPNLGLEISRDASRKAVKVHPLQINTMTNIYIPNTYLHTPTGLFLHHMQKTHCGRENPTIIFAVSQVSKIAGLLLFWTAATTTYSSMRETRSFIPYKVQQHTHAYYIYTHTLCLSFSPEFQFQKPAWVVLIVTPEYQSHNILICYGMKSEVCWRPSFFSFAHIL